MKRRWVGLGIVASIGAGILCAACTGASSPPTGNPDPDPGAPADRITAEALHGSTLDGITVTELPGAVSVELRRLSGPGRFLRLKFSGIWPDPDAVHWTIQPQDGAQLATAVAVFESTAEIGVSCANPLEAGPVVVNIGLSASPLPAGGTTTANPPATAELLSVTELEDSRVQLDWVQALPGDFDFNGKVELADLAALAAALGKSVERSPQAGPVDPAYWLDSDGDGLITPADGAPVAANIAAQVAGFVISSNGEDPAPDAPGTVSISAEQAITSASSPPQYRVELSGDPDDLWRVAAIDAAGRVGDKRTPVRRQYDLVVYVNIAGIGLVDFPRVGDQGNRPGKIGTRVIEPIDVVNRGTIVVPVISSDLVSQFSNVPRNRDLLLDINYVPTYDLGDGLPVEIEAGPVDSLSQVAQAAATAVPFNLPDEPGAGQINVDIFIEPLPAGGYSIEVNAVSMMPGEDLPAFHHTLLNYRDGVLSIDANDDNQVEQGWYFSDGDRDNVSDAWIEQNLQYEAFGLPGEAYSAEGEVLSIDQANARVTVGGLDWFGAPPLDDPLTLNYSEWTVFLAPGSPGEPLLDPALLEAGSRVALVFYRLQDPAGAVGDSYWLDQLVLLDGTGR